MLRKALLASVGFLTRNNRTLFPWRYFLALELTTFLPITLTRRIFIKLFTVRTSYMYCLSWLFWWWNFDAWIITLEGFYLTLSVFFLFSFFVFFLFLSQPFGCLQECRLFFLCLSFCLSGSVQRGKSYSSYYLTIKK